MGAVGTWCAILLPGLLGTAVLWRWGFRQGPGRLAAAIGYGFFLGFLTWVLLFSAQVKLGLPFNPWPLLGVAVVLSVLIAWPLRHDFHIDLPSIPSPRDWGWTQWLGALALVWVGLRLLTLFLAVLWQPLLPWDAWTTWALRAKVWVELGEWVPFVAPEVWLADPEGVTRTTFAWHYPEGLSWVSAWASAAYGAWNEQAANLPWFAALLALLVGFYGQLRRWGLERWAAMVFVWLLSSIPMVGGHVALAGYGDLWVGGLLGLAFMAFLHAVREGDRSQWVIMLVALALSWSLKNEAIVWSLAFIPAFLATRLSARSLVILALGAVLVAVAVVLTTDRITIPGVGTFEWVMADNWRTVAIHLFVFGSWHLFSYVVLGALLWGVSQSVSGRASPAVVGATVWVAAVMVGFYVLFFLTSEAAWAERGTALNRILLQFAPAMMFFVATFLPPMRATPSD